MTSLRGEGPRQQQKQGHSRCQWLEILHGALLRAGPPCLGSGGLWGHSGTAAGQPGRQNPPRWLSRAGGPFPSSAGHSSGGPSISSGMGS